MIESKKIRVCLLGINSETLANYATVINFSEKFKVAGVYSTSRKLFEEAAIKLPNIVVIDCTGMESQDATDIIVKLRSQYEYFEILLTAVPNNNTAFVFSALRSGASGVLSVDSNVFEMMDSLEEIDRGGAPLSRHFARMLVRNFHINANSPMTKREIEILQMIADGKTYSQIAEDLNIAKDTSKTHIRNIYEKLNVASKSEAIQKAKNEKWIRV
jgi:DNA-binding NarL/FixJ family response regulator